MGHRHWGDRQPRHPYLSAKLTPARVRKGLDEADSPPRASSASNHHEHLLVNRQHVFLVLFVRIFRSDIPVYSDTLTRTSAPVDPTAPNFHPVSTGKAPNELFGELEPKDTEWLCSGGFVAETQIWYHILEDGTSLMVQIIHSSIG